MAKKRSFLKTVIGLSVLTVGGLYAINRYISSTALLKNILNPVTGDTYKWKFGDIFYRVDGMGDPVLLIHDAESYASGYEWDNVVSELKKTHTVYTIDLLGCGRSDKPQFTYTSYLYVQLIHDFIEDVIGEPTELVATGLSASFALMSTLCHSEQISKIVMINPNGIRKLCRVPEKKEQVVRAILSAPVVGTAVYNIIHSRFSLDDLLTERFFYNPFKMNKRYTDACYEAAHYGHGAGRFFQASLVGNYMNADVRRAAAMLKVPCTIVYGERLDHADAVAAEYTELNPNIEVIAAPAAKLLPQIETPDVILQAI